MLPLIQQCCLLSSNAASYPAMLPLIEPCCLVLLLDADVTFNPNHNSNLSPNPSRVADLEAENAYQTAMNKELQA